MKTPLIKFLLALFFCTLLGYGQEPSQRLKQIELQLQALTINHEGLNEKVKSDISVNNITLANLLIGIAEVHELNITVDQDLNQITIVNNFPSVTVSDLLVFLCKEYNLTIEFTGNIMAVKKFVPPVEEAEARIIPVVFNPNSQTISIDAKNDKLYDLFKRIMDESGKNLVFSPGLENKNMTIYLNDTPFDSAMDKLAFANNLYVEKTQDNFYLFEGQQTTGLDNVANSGTTTQRPIRRRNANFFFKVLDKELKLLEVDFTNTAIADIINDIGNELGIDMFTATPLEQAGTASFRAKSITFDELLEKLFEAHGGNQQVNKQPGTNNPNPNNSSTSISSQNFSFKKEGNIYFFGLENLLSVRKVDIIYLKHRSVELLSDPMGGGSTSRRTVGRNNNFGGSSTNSYNNNYTSQFDNSFNSQNRNRIDSKQYGSFEKYDTKIEALVNILPEELKEDLDIQTDYELNSFYVNGPSEKIERFKEFIEKIDKPVPVILIEVMFIEVNDNTSLETGIEWGLGDGPTQTQGSIYPQTNLTLGAQTVNKIIDGFDVFGAINLGQVADNFFAAIKLMETNGKVKIKSTPKLSTLNGHRATFSSGQTSYYAVTQRNIYGTDNPQTSEITNYEPIDAELGLTIKPMVAGSGEVTLDIFVIQSSFGARIEENAPPDISSREFSSLIRVNDGDMIVLGGLEDHMVSDTGSGVPLLARIPIIKWLFSERKREGRKAKLTVLIKPTIID